MIVGFCTLTHSLAPSTHSPAHPPTHARTHARTHSLTHSLTPLTHSRHSRHSPHSIHSHHSPHSLHHATHPTRATHLTHLSHHADSFTHSITHSFTHPLNFTTCVRGFPNKPCKKTHSLQKTLLDPSHSQSRHNVLSRYGYDLKTLATAFGLVDTDQKLERFPFGESMLHRSFTNEFERQASSFNGLFELRLCKCNRPKLTQLYKRIWTEMGTRGNGCYFSPLSQQMKAIRLRSPETFTKFVEYATLDAVLWTKSEHARAEPVWCVLNCLRCSTPPVLMGTGVRTV